MSYLIRSEKITFEDFGKMLEAILPNLKTRTERDWYLDNSSTMEVNKDILYHSLHGNEIIKADEKFYVLEGPYDNDGQAQAERFVEGISKKIGDKIVIHNLDDVAFSGYGKNGELLGECWQENMKEDWEEIIIEEYSKMDEEIDDELDIESQVIIVKRHTGNNAIEKFENLEKTAEKFSVREKLKDNQAKIAAKEASAPKAEREKPLQQDISL